MKHAQGWEKVVEMLLTFAVIMSILFGLGVIAQAGPPVSPMAPQVGPQARPQLLPCGDSTNMCPDIGTYVKKEDTGADSDPSQGTYSYGSSSSEGGNVPYYPDVTISWKKEWSNFNTLNWVVPQGWMVTSICVKYGDETKTIDNPSGSSYKFQAPNGITHAVLYLQPLCKGTVTINKTWDGIGPSENAYATFQLKDSSGKPYGEAFTLSYPHEPSETISDVPCGDYTVEEIGVSVGWALNAMPASATVTNGQTATVNFTNHKCTGKIMVVKRWPDGVGAPVDSLPITLQRGTWSDTKIARATANWTVIWDGLTPGCYNVSEANIGGWHEVTGTPSRCVELACADQIVEFANAPDQVAETAGEQEQTIAPKCLSLALSPNSGPEPLTVVATLTAWNAAYARIKWTGPGGSGGIVPATKIPSGSGIFEATFLNLAAGDYTFQGEVSNDGKAWFNGCLANLTVVNATTSACVDLVLTPASGSAPLTAVAALTARNATSARIKWIGPGGSSMTNLATETPPGSGVFVATIGPLAAGNYTFQGELSNDGKTWYDSCFLNLTVTAEGAESCPGTLKITKSWLGSGYENITIRFNVIGPDDFLWQPTITGPGVITFDAKPLTEGTYTAIELDAPAGWMPSPTAVSQVFSCHEASVAETAVVAVAPQAAETEADAAVPPLDLPSLEFVFTNTVSTTVGAEIQMQAPPKTMTGAVVAPQR